MEKYAFLVYHKEYEDFLKELRKLGMVHVIEKSFEETESLRKRKDLAGELNTLIGLLKRRNIPRELAQNGNGLELFNQVKELITEQEANKQKMLALNKDISLLQPWGNFTAENINRMQTAGLNLRFFTCSSRKFEEGWKSQYAIEVIDEVAGNIYFIAITVGQDAIDIDAEELKLPSFSLQALLAEHETLEKRKESINKLLDNAAAQLDLIEGIKKQVFAEMEYEKVVLSTGREAEDRLMMLEGWIPAEKGQTLAAFCDQQGILYISEKPAVTDKVPVLLKNNRFAKLFEPIGKLYSLPAYAELDLTAFFAPFFMIFFGFCLGDAGYGLTILLLVTWYKIFRAKPDMKPLLTLVQFLGAATILMGMVSGTVFGVNLLDTGYLLTSDSFKFLKESGVPDTIISKVTSLAGQHFETRDEYFKALTAAAGDNALKAYKMEFMRSSFSDYAILNKFRHLILDSASMFNLALIFGMIQILFGMGVKAANMVKQKGYIFSVSTVSWIFLILGLIVINGGAAAGYVPEESVKTLNYIIGGIGLSGILFFNDPASNIFISFGKGLYDIYGMVTGIFGDLLSYIRLFALGTSGAILGLVIDKIALQFLGIAYAGPVLFVIFLLIGHTLVLLLSVLGAFVHPLRLTFVEFYKNSGFAGGGKGYKPFSN
jgi:V/A-type H+-transporting ATPase subunit I